ncbi:uncharacterized protein J3D65DRAFT_318006 [Phyllosticta citribraziliensis]|uniref:Uncharacterized protein n=1 Tax=Phyllosticta citribraziliensis TaxID=989973 RepID=A0ABR1LSM1_9PEZI
MSCSADSQNTLCQPNELTVKTDISVRCHVNGPPSIAPAHSPTKQNSNTAAETLHIDRQQAPSPQSPSQNITMKSIEPSPEDTVNAPQPLGRPLRPSPVTLETAQKPHDHPLDWVEEMTPSWYPEHSATPPEVCLWASSPAHIWERHWIKAASTDEDAEDDSVRVASILRRAEETLYEVSANVGLKFPEFGRGYPLRLRSNGPHEMFPRGSKGLKRLGEGQSPVEIPDGARYCASGYYFAPAPTKLDQMMTVADASMETCSTPSNRRKPSGSGPQRPALSQSTAQMSESDTEADMEEIPLTSPSTVSGSPPTSNSPPSSPPCLPTDSPSRDYHGPVDQYPGALSDDSDGSVYSEDLDSFLKLEASDTADCDQFHEESLHYDHLDDFEPDAVTCTAAPVRLEPANENQRKDLVDSICDGCDHGKFAPNKSSELPDLPSGYRWTAHSFALRHSGPRLIVYAPPPVDHESDDDISCIGSDGTSEYFGSPVKLMQNNRPSLWFAPIPEQDETDYNEPVKTLYEGFMTEYGSMLGRRAVEPHKCHSVTFFLTDILRFLGLT